MFFLTSSASFCKNPFSSTYQPSGSGGVSWQRPSSNCNHSHVVCQTRIDMEEYCAAATVSRRLAAVATVGASMGLFSQEAAYAARRKTLEADAKQPEDDESLSGYDAKLLATYKRKEAMKQALQREKAMGKQIGGALTPPLISPPPPTGIPKTEPEAPTTAAVPVPASEKTQGVSTPAVQ